jgi:hypothetical protein
MGKWLAPNAVHCSHGLEGTKRPLIQLIICLTNITGITSKSKHTVKYPDWPSAIWPGPHSEEVHVPKSLEKLTFSDDNSDSDEEKGTILIAIQHLKQVVPHLLNTQRF